LFNGEKTVLFWVGLVIVAFASTTLLFNPLWNVVQDSFRGYGFEELKFQVPNFVSGIAFTLVGLYMMKSGVKKKA
jgi:hypothetical protein